MTFDEDLNTLGQLCPLPVLKARKRLAALPTGAVLRLRADDPAAVVDVPHFCNESGHAFLGMQEHGRERHFFIRKQ